jgi:hypothetical protein
MSLAEELRSKLGAIAARSAQIKALCINEESTKQHLVLPVLSALGYDYTDPTVILPEFPADFRNDAADRVDYAIMIGNSPVIAVECKKVGSSLAEHRGQLCSYFTALRTVRLGILTDGITFEFFTDWDNENVMDLEPFLVLDLDAATRKAVPSDVAEVLSFIYRSNFQPDIIAEIVETRLVALRLRTVLVSELKDPSEEFCRMALQRVGLKNLRKSSIRSRYSALIRKAFEEALVMPVLERMRSHRVEVTGGDEVAADGIVTTDRELAIYRYVCRRLAYLAQDEHQFSAIERVQYKDYIGKFVVYYQNVRIGRLFEYFEGENGYDKFVFPHPHGDIVTNNVFDIDAALQHTFFARVRELGAVRTVA